MAVHRSLQIVRLSALQSDRSSWASLDQAWLFVIESRLPSTSSGYGGVARPLAQLGRPVRA